MLVLKAWDIVLLISVEASPIAHLNDKQPTPRNVDILDPASGGGIDLHERSYGCLIPLRLILEISYRRIKRKNAFLTMSSRAKR